MVSPELILSSQNGNETSTPIYVPSLSDFKPGNPSKVIGGIAAQFTGYALIGTAIGVTVAAASVGGPESGIAAAHFLLEVGGGTSMFYIGGISWWKGYQLIKEGYSELPCERGK